MTLEVTTGMTGRNACPARGQMTHTTILTRLEMESMGPPAPEEWADTDVSEGFLTDLALKHVAQSPEPTTASIADEMRLPRSLVEGLLHALSREKLIEVK